MESLFILIPIAAVIVACAVGVFFWAVKNGQYDDLDAEGRRVLFDDAPKKPKTTLTKSLKEKDKA